MSTSPYEWADEWADEYNESTANESIRIVIVPDGDGSDGDEEEDV